MWTRLRFDRMPEDWKAVEGPSNPTGNLRYCFGLVGSVAGLEPVAGVVCAAPL
jgi:hypothetical protein